MATGAAPALETQPPEPLSEIAKWSVGIYLILVNLTLLYLLAKLWPGDLKTLHGTVSLFGFKPTIWPETRFLLIVMVAAALGSYVHLATSFADFLGNRQLCSSWTWWYILRPFIGMALGLVLYFALRGGLIAGDTGAAQLSPYGVAALAGLAGMFSKQASDKLREIFENLFKTEKKTERKDALTN